MDSVTAARFAATPFPDARAEVIKAELHVAGWQEMAAIPKATLFRKGDLVVASFRGTVLSDLEDLATDAALIVGSEDSTLRFKRAISWVHQLVRRFPSHRLVLCGFSLGGSICLACCYQVGKVREVHTFGAFGSPQMVLRSLLASALPFLPFRHYMEATLHLVKQDPIALTAQFMAQVAFDIRDLPAEPNPHSLQVFLQ